MEDLPPVAKMVGGRQKKRVTGDEPSGKQSLMPVIMFTRACSSDLAKNGGLQMCTCIMAGFKCNIRLPRLKLEQRHPYCPGWVERECG